MKMINTSMLSVIFLSWEYWSDVTGVPFRSQIFQAQISTFISWSYLCATSSTSSLCPTASRMTIFASTSAAVLSAVSVAPTMSTACHHRFHLQLHPVSTFFLAGVGTPPRFHALELPLRRRPPPPPPHCSRPQRMQLLRRGFIFNGLYGPLSTSSSKAAFSAMTSTTVPVSQTKSTSILLFTSKWISCTGNYQACPITCKLLT